MNGGMEDGGRRIKGDGGWRTMMKKKDGGQRSAIRSILVVIQISSSLEKLY